MGGNGRSVGSDVVDKNVNDKEEEEEDDDDDLVEEDEKVGFFACYLLISLSPRYKGHTYIGFTVNPKRRIKQHNGEMTSGAWRTKSKRPWEMALCIYGFPTNIAALQFEWAWQHPTESLAVRKAASRFKSFFGIANKVKLAFTMLTLPAWQSMDLTVNFFSTKYQRHCAGCPRLPEQMNMQMCSLDELPCYTGYEQNVYRHVELDIEETDGLAEEHKERLEYSTVPNYVDCRNRTEKMTHVPHLNIGKSDLIQPRTVQKYNYHTQPSSSHVAETFQGSISQLGEACSVELVSPASKDLLNITAPGKDKVLMKDPMVLSNVEVVDLSTPEPGSRTSLHTKNGRTDNSKFIDLTKSPIYL